MKPKLNISRQHWQFVLVGITISLFCGVVLRRQVDFNQSWKIVSQLKGSLLWIPFAVFLCNLPMRAWRWRLIFLEDSRPSYGSCLTVLGIGNMINFLLPARA